MPSPLHFADAQSDYASSEAVIFGIPFDRTTSFRPGARFAPNAIREASWNFESYLFNHHVDLREIRVHDAGDMEEFGSVDEMCDEVHAQASSYVRDGKFLLTLGGEHSVIPPVISAFPSDIFVIVLDAHLDFRDQYLGMRNSHACASRRISEHVGRKNMLLIGIRSVALEDLQDAEGLEYIDAYAVAEKGMEFVRERVSSSIKGRRVYLSIDIDCIDPAFAPGTGTPEPFGLSPLLVKNVISWAGRQMVGADIVEVSPPYDNGNTSALAARLAREIIATRHSAYVP